jgi:hypothetical protein
MIVSKTIECDMPDCCEQLTVSAKEILRDYNWVASPGQHLCPKHRHMTWVDLENAIHASLLAAPRFTPHTAPSLAPPR